jgi:hypothetical protein
MVSLTSRAADLSHRRARALADADLPAGFAEKRNSSRRVPLLWSTTLPPSLGTPQAISFPPPSSSAAGLLLSVLTSTGALVIYSPAGGGLNDWFSLVSVNLPTLLAGGGQAQAGEGSSSSGQLGKMLGNGGGAKGDASKGALAAGPDSGKGVRRLSWCREHWWGLVFAVSLDATGAIHVRSLLSYWRARIPAAADTPPRTPTRSSRFRTRHLLRSCSSPSLRQPPRRPPRPRPPRTPRRPTRRRRSPGHPRAAGATTSSPRAHATASSASGGSFLPVSMTRTTKGRAARRPRGASGQVGASLSCRTTGASACSIPAPLSNLSGRTAETDISLT